MYEIFKYNQMGKEIASSRVAGLAMKVISNYIVVFEARIIMEAILIMNKPDDIR